LCATESCLAGEEAKNSFTLKYAAPETIITFKNDHTSIVADAAVDVWAFGMICYELLTHRSFYGSSCDGQGVMEQLLSETPLPSERALHPDVAGAHTLYNTAAIYLYVLFPFSFILWVKRWCV
jgi:serine/threonine protein kinase